PVMSVCRPVMIRGIAMLTIVVSTRIMKNPITRDHRAGHGRNWRGSTGGSPVSGAVVVRVMGGSTPDRCNWTLCPAAGVAKRPRAQPGERAAETDLAGCAPAG